MTPSISVSFDRVRPLLDQAASAGIDVAEFLSALGLSSLMSNRGETEEVPLADYYRIQNRLSILFGDETVHMSSRQLLPGSTDFVLQHVGDCKNLFEVMRVIARSYNLLHGGQFNAVEKKKGSVDYVVDDRSFPYAIDAPREYFFFSIECVLIFLHCMLMIVSPSAEAAVKGLQLRRPTPGGDCGHLGYWDAPIRFGAEVYRISFDRDVALKPIRPPTDQHLTSNAVYQKIVEVVAGRHARHGYAASTAALVRDALSRGIVEQTDVARQMGVSVATVRRHLAQEGVSFRDLRREVLNESAKRQLVAGRPVAEVAEALGFSEFRAFNRAFKDWNGVTPKAFARSAGRSSQA